MPKKLSETDNFQLTLTKSLIDQLDALALTGMYGSQRQSVIESILSEEVRRLRASGQFNHLRDIKSYPARNDDGGKEDEQ